MNAIYLTRDQILNMAKGGCEGEGPDDCHDIVVEIDNGTMIIHSAENLMSDNNWEGSGVYLDAKGNEHFSPGYPFAEDKNQNSFHANPEKWLDFETRHKEA